MFRILIAGLIAGWLTGKLMHGRGFGFVADIVLGLIGAVIGNWIFGQLGVAASGGIGFIAMAVVGAIILVGAIHLIRGDRFGPA
ncbi:MAG TPA: GlsB/YeaQ/YmgE family stress response membrane protein [Candidatus Binataceae bacterium]|nr:GlsB/YeaQ/YmgE family stress response membrane protein [Candidatus Binataceae bacterium]